jgi:transposase
MRGKRAALVAALDGRVDAHHAELARMPLDHDDALTAQIDRRTARIQQLLGAIPAAQAPPGRGRAHRQHRRRHHRRPARISRRPSPRLGALERLDDVPGIGPTAAQVLIAELGLDLGQFPTPGHLVPWARRSPPTIQSGATRRAGEGNPPARACSARSPPRPPRPTPSAASAPAGWCGASASARPSRQRPLDPGDRLAPAGRPTARFQDLGAGSSTSRIDRDRKTRNHVRQLQALGSSVTLNPAA